MRSMKLLPGHMPCGYTVCWVSWLKEKSIVPYALQPRKCFRFSSLLQTHSFTPPLAADLF